MAAAAAAAAVAIEEARAESLHEEFEREAARIRNTLSRDAVEKAAKTLREMEEAGLQPRTMQPTELSKEAAERLEDIKTAIIFGLNATGFSWANSVGLDWIKAEALALSGNAEEFIEIIKVATEAPQKQDEEDNDKTISPEESTRLLRVFWNKKAEDLGEQIAENKMAEERAWQNFDEAKRPRRSIARRIEEERRALEEAREEALKEAQKCAEEMNRAEQQGRAIMMSLPVKAPPTTPNLITYEGKTMTLSQYHASRQDLAKEEDPGQKGIKRSR